MANTERLAIMVSGMVASVPHQGGATWSVLQYLLGFSALGHEVWFVEQVSDEARRPPGTALARTLNAQYCDRVMSEVGLADRWALVAPSGTETAGLEYRKVHAVARRADVHLNISGSLSRLDLIGRAQRCVYLDVDPAFTQLWQAVEGIDMGLYGHTHFASIGTHLNEPGGLIPTCGKSWLQTLPPVDLAHWPRATALRYPALTTVGNWRSYGSVEHNGRFFGQKAHSLREFITLPEMTDEEFVLALAIDPRDVRDLEALRMHGWRLVDPARVAASPRSYQSFVQGSWAEFGIAKSGYVASSCGWLSDRSVCYLASGRPVVAQDTGFADRLPTGEGLLIFTTADDVLCAIDCLRHDYAKHRLAARALAEEYFDASIVLPALLDRIGGVAGVGG